MSDLLPTITGYIKYLSDKAYGKPAQTRSLPLKEKKLKAEIALKESQGGAAPPQDRGSRPASIFPSRKSSWTTSGSSCS